MPEHKTPKLDWGIDHAAINFYPDGGVHSFIIRTNAKTPSATKSDQPFDIFHASERGALYLISTQTYVTACGFIEHNKGRIVPGLYPATG